MVDESDLTGVWVSIGFVSGDQFGFTDSRAPKYADFVMSRNLFADLLFIHLASSHKNV